LAIRDPKYQFPNLPLIALSSSIKGSAKKCEGAGYDAFLTKPLQRKKLFQMIERIMGERQEKGEKEEAARQKIMAKYSVREDMKHSVRVLLAEDNPVNQKLAKMVLTKAGYQVEVANNGQEAVENITSSPDDFEDSVLLFLFHLAFSEGLWHIGQLRMVSRLGQMGWSTSLISNKHTTYGSAFSISQGEIATHKWGKWVTLNLRIFNLFQYVSLMGDLQPVLNLEKENNHSDPPVMMSSYQSHVSFVGVVPQSHQILPFSSPKPFFDLVCARH
jgi:CheY-like chemotaxis protein